MLTVEYLASYEEIFFGSSSYLVDKKLFIFTKYWLRFHRVF